MKKRSIFALLIALVLVTTCENVFVKNLLPEFKKSGGDAGYTVIFDKNHPDVGDWTNAFPATKTVAAPATVIDMMPNPPTRTGYVFAGWNTEADGSGEPFTEASPVEDDITVYAQWELLSPNAFVVAFDRNNAAPGGTDAYPVNKTVTPPVTTITSLPVEPTQPGHSFTGWNTKADGSGTAFTDATTVTTNITVYAQWGLAQSGGTPVIWQGSATRNPTDPQLNWAYYNTTNNTTYIWTGTRWDVFAAPNNLGGAFIVTFNRNHNTPGGTDAYPASIPVLPPARTINALPIEPTYPYHYLAGWNTRADGSGSEFTATTSVTASVTVYAQWEPLPLSDRIVTFDKNTTDSNSVNASPLTITLVRPEINVLFLPEPPSRPGYIFAGWNKEPDGSGAVFTGATSVSASITVYAQWTLSLVTVSPTNGMILSPVSPESSFTIVLGAQPAGDVVISLTSADPTLVSVDPAWMAFNATNWNTPQTATVEAMNVPVDSHTPFTINTALITGTGIYEGLIPDDVNGLLFSTKDSAEFSFTQGVQRVSLSAGTYKLEVWGAQGGKSEHGTRGGYGGYSVGTVTLNELTDLYIYVGGQPTSVLGGGYNGGGKGGIVGPSNNPSSMTANNSLSAQSDTHSGGGATDIRIGSTSLFARVIVAGGGGASGCSSTTGGEGGGPSGTASTSTLYPPHGGGGTQIAGGTSQGTNAGFGYGGDTTYSLYWPGGAGGGGWYGGGAGSNQTGGGGVGGGGSGWVYTASAFDAWELGNPEDAAQWLLDSSYYLSNASITTGGTSVTLPGGGTGTGRIGNGYARITLLSSP